MVLSLPLTWSLALFLTRAHFLCLSLCLPSGGLRTPAEKKLLSVFFGRQVGGELLATFVCQTDHIHSSIPLMLPGMSLGDGAEKHLTQLTCLSESLRSQPRNLLYRSLKYILITIRSCVKEI